MTKQYKGYVPTQGLSNKEQIKEEKETKETYEFMDKIVDDVDFMLLSYLEKEMNKGGKYYKKALRIFPNDYGTKKERNKGFNSTRYIINRLAKQLIW